MVLAESFWRDHFAGTPQALGADLILSGRPHVVVGVMPARFKAPPRASGLGSLPPGEPQFWTPLTPAARRGWKNVSVLGRLAPGVSLETASARLTASQDELTAIYPDYRGAWAEDLLGSVVGDVRATLWFLLGAVGLVLLVANVNIANILAASGFTRRRELAVRAAIGAGPRRLASGLLLESAVLAALGGIGGGLLAWSGLPVLMRYVPPTLPRQESIGIGAGVLLFGIAVTGVTALLTGMLPAVSASRADPQVALRRSASSLTPGLASRGLRSGLVVAEMSLAFVLLVGAALLGNSYLRLWSVERGFSTEGLVAMWVVPDRATHGTREEVDAFTRTLTARLGEIPGVRATAVNNLPLSGMRSGTAFYIERSDGGVDVLENAILTVVLDSYFDVLGVPIVDGRAFDRDDTRGSPLVAIVSREMARQYWPGADPIGQRLRTYDDSTASVEVVGIAGDVRHTGLAVDAEPTVYLPASQSGRVTNEAILRVQGDVGDAVRSAREVVARLSPATPVRRVVVLDQAIQDSVAIPRFRTVLVLGLAGLAAALALLGVYGVVSYTVAQSTKEVGVRKALGAHSNGEVGRVMRGGFKLGLAGVGLGLVLALSGADILTAFLFEVAPTDPVTYLLVALSVLVVSAGAAYVPARRAASIQPVTALKSE